MKKKALVSGGSGTIGRAICLHLATQDFNVLVHGRDREKTETVVAQIIEAHGTAQAICFDITDPGDCQHALQAYIEKEAIQVIVHNAGIHDDAPMAGMNLAQWHNVFNVNLHGFYNIVQPLLLPMMRTRWGRIISVSSISAMLGNRGQTNYAGAKAALHAVSKSLALELASRGITVNVVAPGIIESPLTAELFDKTRINQFVPMKRAGQPHEVAHLIGFLASENAAYISGQIIGINGSIC